MGKRKGHQNNNGTTPSTPCHTKGDQTNINTDDVSQLAEGVESKDKGQNTRKNPSTTYVGDPKPREDTVHQRQNVPDRSQIVGQTSNNADESGQTSSVRIFICGLVMLLLAICFNINCKDNMDVGCTFNKTLALSQSRQFIKDLKNQFPSQTEDTWKKLITLTWKINQTCNPQWKMPLVYTLAHRVGAFNTSRCLTMKILQAVRRRFIQLNAEGQYSAKHDVNNALKHAFTKQLNDALPSKGIAIFNDLQSLNSELADQFRIYCDNTDAPYKQAVILFHVTLDETYDDVLLSTDEIYMENVVTKVLRKSWPLMEESSFDPLSVRILQNIVIINAEEHLDGC